MKVEAARSKEQEQHKNCMRKWTLIEKGEKAIFRLAKFRGQANKGNYQGYFVKAQDDTLLMNTEENISRWARCIK